VTVRELNGEPQASVTFDPDGNVLSVTVAEPRFTPADKATLLASRRLEMAPRGDHGILLAEALDPANQFAFEVEPPVMDWAAGARNSFIETYKKRHPNVDMSAMHIRVRRRD